MDLYLRTVLLATARQAAGLLGVFLLPGLALALLERMTSACFNKTVGWRAGLWTGLVGVPVHEIGHIVLCVVFRHRIVKFRLYEPDPRTGTLGYVEHSWNRKSRLQSAGNFFVGIAPLFTGSLAVWFLARLLVPEIPAAFSAGFPAASGSLSATARAWSGAVARAASVLAEPGRFASPRPWAFLLLGVSIAAHAAPSWEDMRSAWGVIGGAVGLLLAANAAAAGLGADLAGPMAAAARFAGGFAGVLLLCLSLSLANFAGTYLLLGTYSWTRRRRVLVPF